MENFNVNVLKLSWNLSNEKKKNKFNTFSTYKHKISLFLALFKHEIFSIIIRWLTKMIPIFQNSAFAVNLNE